MDIHEFMLIAVLHAAAMISPGPDFVMVTHHSLKYGRKSGIMCSAGIAIGILVHVTYCMLGLAVIIAQSAVVFSIFKFIAALYLIFLGCKAFLSRKRDAQKQGFPENEKPSLRKSLLTGFITNAFNPKVTLFFLSMYTLVISKATPVSAQMFYGGWMCVLTFLWFLLITVLFTNNRTQIFFKRTRGIIDKVTGGIFIALGIKLITSSR